MEGRRTFLTIPELARTRLLTQADTWEMEPLIHTSCIVTGDHVSIAHVIAETVGGFLARTCWHSITLVVARRAALPNEIGGGVLVNQAAAT